MEHGIAASTSNANHGIGFMLQNVEPRSTSSSGSDHADDNRKMPAFCPPIATTQSFVALDPRSSISNLIAATNSSHFTPADCGIYNTSDDTPMVIVSTCKAIAHHCHENKTTMTQEQKVSTVCAINALSSCPRNAAYVNVVNAMLDLPTPDRADEVMAYAEDELQNCKIS